MTAFARNGYSSIASITRMTGNKRPIAEEFRKVEQETGLGNAARLDLFRSLQERIWRCFEKDELDASQHGMLTGAIQESMRQITEPTAESRHSESGGNGGRSGDELS